LHFKIKVQKNLLIKTANEYRGHSAQHNKE